MRWSLLKLFRKHPYYSMLMAVTFLSGVGTTLTALAIYHELVRLGASGFLFTLAFALTILPGLVSSQLAA